MFSRSRRSRRDPAQLAARPDPIRDAVGLPIGEDGCYFVAHADEGPFAPPDSSIIRPESPPDDQPTFWCDWCPSNDGAEILWNEGDKFYLYVEWLEYLLQRFLIPWGYVLNGEVEWYGEEDWDTGVISVEHNEIEVLGPTYVTEGDEVRRLRAFLCHAKEDAGIVKQIQERLEAEYVHAWMDETDLIAGQDWRLAIEQAIEQADLVIVCLSNSSVGKHGFVQKEISLALDLVDMQPEGQTYVIPLLLEECTVPRRLQKWQWLDLAAENFEPSLRAALLKRAEEVSTEAQPNKTLGPDV